LKENQHFNLKVCGNADPKV